MNPKRLLLLALILLPVAIFSGCNSSYEHDETGLYAKHNRGTNVLGIVDTSPASYKRIPSTTDDVHSYDLYKRKNVSGNNVSLLWGAFTFADY